MYKHIYTYIKGSVPGLGRSPEKEMATHSSITAWKIPQTEEPGGLQSIGSQELDMTEWLNSTHIYVFCIYMCVYARFYLLIFCLGLLHPCLSAELTFKFSFSIFFLFKFITKLHQLYQVVPFPYFLILWEVTVTDFWFFKNLM